MHVNGRSGCRHLPGPDRQPPGDAQQFPPVPQARYVTHSRCWDPAPQRVRHRRYAGRRGRDPKDAARGPLDLTADGHCSDGHCADGHCPTNEADHYPTNEAYRYPTNEAYRYPTNEADHYRPNEAYRYRPNEAYRYRPNEAYRYEAVHSPLTVADPCLMTAACWRRGPRPGAPIPLIDQQVFRMTISVWA